jgi:hypothetical protein
MSTFDYTSRDYASIQADLLARAEVVLPQWTSRDPSDFGMLMVDLWSYMGDVLHYYVDRAAGESSLQKATQRESVLAVASLLDYIPASRTSAGAQVTLDASATGATNTNPIIIPQYFRFTAQPKVSSASDVVFTLNHGVAITATLSGFYTDPLDGKIYTAVPKNTPFTVSLTEGELFEETIKSTGKPDQQIQLTNTGVVTSSIEVLVAEGAGGSNVSYAYYPRLVQALATQPAFSVDFNASDRTLVNFGNGINGKIPLTNSEILIKYRRSRGRAGNLPPNSIKGFESIVTPTGQSLSGIIVNSNTVNTVGGSDSESLDSMKANIPLSFRVQDRAVSLIDYRDLTLRVPGVNKAIATLSGANVLLYAVSAQGDYESRSSTQNSIAIETELSSDITEYLSTRSVVGVAVSVASSTPLNHVRITARINVLDGFIQEKVKEAVNTAVTDLFSFETCEYGMKVSLGTLYRTILAVAGVDYATVSQFTTTTGATTIDNVTVSGIKTFEGVSAVSNGMLYIATDFKPTFTIVGGITGSAI